MPRDQSVKKKCKVDGCERPSRALKMCTRHYQQVKTTGHTYEVERFEVCQAESCESKPRSGTAKYCEMHYYRLRRNRTLETIAEKVPNQMCLVDGCKRMAERVDGLCRGCHGRRERNGTFEYQNTGERAYNWRSDEEMNYKTIHQRVKTKRGKASNYACIDCNKTAFHWSYSHASKNERLVPHENGALVPVGTDIYDYDPRCVPCHKKFDLERKKLK